MPSKKETKRASVTSAYIDKGVVYAVYITFTEEGGKRVSIIEGQTEAHIKDVLKDHIKWGINQSGGRLYMFDADLPRKIEL